MPSRVYIDDDSRCLRWVSGIKKLSVFKDNLNAKFIPIQKPVSFNYALDKGLEGKRIKFDVSKLDEFKNSLIPYNNIYYNIEIMFEILSEITFLKEAIKKESGMLKDKHIK